MKNGEFHGQANKNKNIFTIFDTDSESRSNSPSSYVDDSACGPDFSPPKQKSARYGIGKGKGTGGPGVDVGNAVAHIIIHIAPKT